MKGRMVVYHFAGLEIKFKRWNGASFFTIL